MQVLVVDDEPELRLLARAMFEREQINVTEAADGAAAIALLATEPPFDVVLLDVKLPDMPGGEVLRRLREIDATIKVAVLTADAPDAHRARDLIHGADLYFVKPFSVRELVANVIELGDR